MGIRNYSSGHGDRNNGQCHLGEKYEKGKWKKRENVKEKGR
jgi:hypothetical protein